jgi:hypothetical protein
MFCAGVCHKLLYNKRETKSTKHGKKRKCTNDDALLCGVPGPPITNQFLEFFQAKNVVYNRIFAEEAVRGFNRYYAETAVATSKQTQSPRETVDIISSSSSLAAAEQ